MRILARHPTRPPQTGGIFPNTIVTQIEFELPDDVVEKSAYLDDRQALFINYRLKLSPEVAPGQPQALPMLARSYIYDRAEYVDPMFQLKVKGHYYEALQNMFHDAGRLARDAAREANQQWAPPVTEAVAPAVAVDPAVEHQHPTTDLTTIRGIADAAARALEGWGAPMGHVVGGGATADTRVFETQIPVQIAFTDAGNGATGVAATVMNGDVAQGTAFTEEGATWRTGI